MPDRSRGRFPLVVAVAVGIVLIIVVRSLSTGGHSKHVARSKTGPCTTLAVTASSEKAALLKQIAATYNEQSKVVEGHCAQVTVTSKASGGAEQALARGWTTADGPRPDVWTPAASAWAVVLRQRLDQTDKPALVPPTTPSIAKTPLTLAMPKPMAQALGWPGKKIGWGDVLALARDPRGWGRFGHPEWGAFKLGKTNPDFSTSGLNATIATYFAATGRSSDLTLADVRSKKVTDYVHAVESSVVHYGDTTLTFLSNLQAADDSGRGLTYISAVAVEEKSVWDYNQGNPTGDPTTLGRHPKPHTPLVAIYPREGTLFSDNPYIVLTAPWVDAAKRAVAQDFLSFVQADDQQRRFQQAAFRSYQGATGDRITPANGLLPTEPTVVLSPPAPGVLSEVQKSFDELRKRARALLVIDVSGSMGDTVEGTGKSKLQLAQDAALRALRQFAPDDELGLWIFSSQGGSSPPYQQLVPVGLVRKNLPALQKDIADLQPGGGTPLYTTAEAAERQMTAQLDLSRINAVVLLTDGKNEYKGGPDLQTVVGELAGESGEATVRLFPIAYGKDADLASLTQLAKASHGAAYDASDPSTIDNVFTAVVSNF